MENNLGKLKADAEARILQVMEEEETLRKEVHEKKCQYLSIVTEERINKCLDMQVRIPSFLVFLLKEVEVKQLHLLIKVNIGILTSLPVYLLY